VQRFGRKLRQIREDQDFSQEELADKAGLHRTYISMVERGERSVALASMEKLAKALGLQIQDLLP